MTEKELEEYLQERDAEEKRQIGNQLYTMAGTSAAGLGLGTLLGPKVYESAENVVNNTHRMKHKDLNRAAKLEMFGSNEMADFLKKRGMKQGGTRLPRLEKALKNVGSAKNMGRYLGAGGALAGALVGPSLYRLLVGEDYETT